MSYANEPTVPRVREGVELPPDLPTENAASLPGWRVVKNFDNHAFRQRAREANRRFLQLRASDRAGTTSDPAQGRSSDVGGLEKPKIQCSGNHGARFKVLFGNDSSQYRRESSTFSMQRCLMAGGQANQNKES
jgi:hypothetical protein